MPIPARLLSRPTVTNALKDRAAALASEQRILERIEGFDASRATPQAIDLLAFIVTEHLRAHGSSAKLEDAMQNLYLLRLNNEASAQAFERAWLDQGMRDLGYRSYQTLSDLTPRFSSQYRRALVGVLLVCFLPVAVSPPPRLRSLVR